MRVIILKIKKIFMVMIMIKVAVTGALGRMGSNIIKTITQQEDMKVVCAFEVPNHPKKERMLES